MIDQSAFMSVGNVKYDKNFSSLVANMINFTITEIIKNATRQKCEDDEYILDLFKVVVLGYGGVNGELINVFCEGYLSDIASTWKLNNGFYNILVYNILEPMSGSFTVPMISALNKVENYINCWKNEGHNTYKDPIPLIINITSGVITDNNGIATNQIFNETIEAVEKIRSISFPNGETCICNIWINHRNEDEVYFPNDIHLVPQNSFSKFIYTISSNVTENFGSGFRRDKFLDNITPNSKMLIINPSYSPIEFLLIPIIIRFFATIGGSEPFL